VALFWARLDHEKRSGVWSWESSKKALAQMVPSSWSVVWLATGFMVERPMPDGFVVGGMKRVLFGRLILLQYGGAELVIRSGSMVIPEAIL
jgi:hypothetical protein